MWLSNPKHEWQRQNRKYHTDGLSAVYAIRHVPTDRYYVGSAVNLYGRWKTHRSALSYERHTSPYLQNSWNAHDANEFQWIILESVPDKMKLIEVEQRWIDGLRATDRNRGFNLCPRAGSSLGRKHSAEFKAKKSLVMRGNKFTLGHKLSDEHKMKIGLKSKGHPPNDAQKKAAELATSRWWRVGLPSGEILTLKNLRRFCLENGVSQTTLHHLAVGKTKINRKGWRCWKLIKEGGSNG